MKVSAEVEIACSLALREAVTRRHDVMAVEHLLFALLQDDATAKVVKKSGGNLEKLRKRLERVLEEEFQPTSGLDPVQPTPTRGFQRVLQRAAIHVQSSGKDELKGFNVLIAIFAEADSPAVQAMGECGLSRYDVVNFISHGISKDASDDALEMSESGKTAEDEENTMRPPQRRSDSRISNVPPTFTSKSSRGHSTERATLVLAARWKTVISGVKSSSSAPGCRISQT